MRRDTCRADGDETWHRVEGVGVNSRNETRNKPKNSNPGNSTLAKCYCWRAWLENCYEINSKTAYKYVTWIISK